MPCSPAAPPGHVFSFCEWACLHNELIDSRPCSRGFRSVGRKRRSKGDETGDVGTHQFSHGWMSALLYRSFISARRSRNVRRTYFIIRAVALSDNCLLPGYLSGPLWSNVRQIRRKWALPVDPAVSTVLVGREDISHVARRIELECHVRETLIRNVPKMYVQAGFGSGTDVRSSNAASIAGDAGWDMCLLLKSHSLETLKNNSRNWVRVSTQCKRNNTFWKSKSFFVSLRRDRSAVVYSPINRDFEMRANVQICAHSVKLFGGFYTLFPDKLEDTRLVRNFQDNEIF